MMNALGILAGLVLLWHGGLHAWQWALGGLVAGMLALRGSREGDSGLRPWLWPFVGLAAWGAISAFWSLRPQAGLTEALALLSLTGMAAWAVRRGPDAQGLGRLWLALGLAAGAAFLAAGWGIGRSHAAEGLEHVAGFALPHHAARTFFPNQNLVAGGLLLPALLFAIPAAAARPWRWLGAGVLLAAALAYAGSRGAFLSAAAGLALLAVRSTALAQAWRRRVLLVLTAAAAMVAAAALFLPFSRLVQRQQWQSTPAMADPNYFRRGDFWKGSLRLALERPLFGYGLGAYEAAAQRLDLPTPLTRRNPVARYRLRLEHAHNALLEAWVELGVLGPLLALIGLGLFVRARWRLPARSVDPWQAAGEAALASAGVFALTDLNAQTPALLAGYSLLAGSLGKGGSVRTLRWPRTLFFAAGTLLAFIGAGYALRQVASKSASPLAYAGARALLPLDQGVAAEHALRLGGQRDPEAFLALLGRVPERPRDAAWESASALAHYLGAQAAAAPREERERELELALVHSDRSLALSPYRANAHLLRAQLLLDLGRSAEAQAALARALELEPNFARAWALKKSWALAGGRRGEARSCDRELKRISALRFEDEEPDEYSRSLLSF